VIVSIVTPSYNQGRYLEAAMESVLSQQGESLQYVVMDGGSTDGSAAIIRARERRLHHWQSVPDGGQAAAIAEGFAKTTGGIMGWLNSDDLLLPGALGRVVRAFTRHPGCGFVYGDTLVIDAEGRELERRYWPARIRADHWAHGQPVGQESCFWRREVYDAVGGVDPTKQFIMDYDLFYRMWRTTRFCKIPAFLGAYRVQGESKNARLPHVREAEMAEALQRYAIRPLGWLGTRLANRLDRAQQALARARSVGNGLRS
jgi:glycosyltransferase involved in cell wall biosynthesis